MIWGEIIQELRRFHLNLVEHVPSLLKPHSAEFTFTADDIPYPDSTDDMEDWNPDPMHESVAEWLEFHPVERALLEGPLLPIQKVHFPNDSAFQNFVEHVVKLESKWIDSLPGKAAIPTSWPQELRARFLRIQTRAGVRRLRQA